ncbi:MAG: sigma-54 dependent transcriptional regulator [Desulfuromonadales bacterium]
MELITMMVIDDDAVIREGLRRIFSAKGYAVEIFDSGYPAVERLREKEFDLVVTDLKMPGLNGIEVVKRIKSLQPEVPILIITGYATVDTAVDAMKSGAVDYIAKPFTPDDICNKVQKALEHKAVMLDDIFLRKELKEHRGFDSFIGDSREMQKVYRRILQVAPTDSTVLITGESGTGKEFAARAIHRHSPRHDGPFVAVDCTALAENLLESELFGHVKGSFTGAMQTKTGLFKVTDGGTLFLDEVANISLTTQAKLLRVLQEREITPIGSTQTVPIDIRLVAATNCSLRDLVAAGKFRDDLFFRLNIIPVDLPPLRDRNGDLRLLTGFFIRKFSEEIGKEIKGLAPDALEVLLSYPFTGNVRELENIIERAVVLAENDFIQLENLELHLPDHPRKQAGEPVPQNANELKERKRLLREKSVDEIERAFVLDALKRNDWNITKAAEEVGMLRPNFHALLKKQGISRSNGHGQNLAIASENND